MNSFNIFNSHAATPLKFIPQNSDGFDYHSPTDFEFSDEKSGLKKLNPLTYYCPAKKNAIYQVTLNITAQKNVPTLYIFSSRRQLRAVISLKKGESYTQTFYQSLTSVIPFQSTTCYPLEYLFITLCAEDPTVLDFQASFSKVDVPRMFLCGDSTVADQSTTLPFVPSMSYSSWGQTLPAFISGHVAIDNQATSGNTSESFREEGHYQIVTDNLLPGDYCLFQFGHNDQKLSHLQPNREFETNLIRYIHEIRQAGAQPILVTPFARNTWNLDGEYLNLLQPYDDKMNQIAKKQAVPIIQLHQYTKKIWQKYGKERSTDFFPKGDFTHANEYGSCLAAAFIANALSSFFPEIKKTRQQIPNSEKNAWIHATDRSIKTEKNSDGSQKLHKMENSVQNLKKIIEDAKKA